MIPSIDNLQGVFTITSKMAMSQRFGTYLVLPGGTLDYIAAPTKLEP